jgi:hypothetical protein
MKLRERYSSLCACHRIASDRDFVGSREVNRTLLWRRSVMVEGNAVDSESFRELMIWFPRPSSRSAWNALAGERVAHARCSRLAIRANLLARGPYQYFNSLLALQQGSSVMSVFRFWRRKTPR